jgi:hypothetical protein
MRKIVKILISALLISAAIVSRAQDNTPPLVEPTFLLGKPNPKYSDYRPVLNATGYVVIFERAPTTQVNAITRLYFAHLTTGDPQPVPTFPSRLAPTAAGIEAQRGAHRRPIRVQQR